MVLYTAVLGFAVGKHEPWADEAQAWLIARDCSLKEIFLHRLHYEGTPGLWHLFLWLLSRLHISYTGMHWLTAGVATAAIAIFLRYSPFPTIFRLLLPFTFYLQYQFAVVARSYVFFTLTVFALAALFYRREHRPAMFALICGLLANTSVFGAMAAFGFFIVYAYNLTKAGISWSRLKAPATCFSLLFLVAIYTAVPTPDAVYGPAAKLSGEGRIQHLLSVITFSQHVPPIQDHQLAVQADPLEVALASHQSNSFHDRLWRFLEIRKDVPTPELILRKASMRLYTFLCVLTYPISNLNGVAVLFVFVLLYWLKNRGQLLLLLPYLFVLLFCTVVPCQPHNIGVLWVTLLATLWIALSHPPYPADLDKSYLSLCVLLLLVSVVQITWTIKTIRNDYKDKYDASGMVARFISGLPPEQRRVVAFDPVSVAIEAHFKKNVFDNREHSYWLWSKTENPDYHFREVMDSRPDLVIVEDMNDGNQTVMNQWIELEKPWSASSGTISSRSMSDYPYSSVARFCGQIFVQLGAERQICYNLFEPASTASSLQPLARTKLR
ncbi:MAG TPA: hypothetical protein VHN81_11555 [Edaphobacter sp.]|nr:hypothetical protein [Edaphobacter sp.]